MSTLFAAFSAMTGGAASETTENAQGVVAAAQNLASKFNSISANLATVATNTNEAIQTGVTAANQDLTTIANLNQQIANATAGGETADTLVDQRQASLQDLANYANISTSTESNGSVDVSIGGVSMVSGFTTPDQLQAYDAGGGQIMVQAQNAGTPLNITGGSIGGSIIARDGTPNDPGLTALQTGLDNAASNLITQVNSVYQASTGQPFFTGNSAATIAVDSSVDPGSLLSSVQADGSLASDLNGVSTTPISNLGNQTLTQSYAATVSNLGNSINTATQQLGDSQTLALMLANQQSSVSGVNTDEEMTNLLEYQKAYEASAELVSTVSSMLETVIDMGYEG
jgi:flagellar hook-associated protein 1 FlgK